MIGIESPVGSLISGKESPRFSFLNVVFQRVVIVLAESVDVRRLETSDNLKELIVQDQTAERRVEQNSFVHLTFHREGKQILSRTIRTISELVLTRSDVARPRMKRNRNLNDRRDLRQNGEIRLLRNVLDRHRSV